MQWVVAVRAEEVSCAHGDKRMGGVVVTLGPIEHQAHRKGGLSVGSDARGVAEFGQPRQEVGTRDVDQWREHVGVWAGCRAQVCVELEQPCESIRALKAWPLAKVRALDSNFVGLQALCERGVCTR